MSGPIIPQQWLDSDATTPFTPLSPSRRAGTGASSESAIFLLTIQTWRLSLSQTFYLGAKNGWQGFPKT